MNRLYILLLVIAGIGFPACSDDLPLDETAQTKYGYKAKYGMRSVEEGVTAINEGCNVLGFGFMDKEELGERLLQAWQKKYGA